MVPGNPHESYAMLVREAIQYDIPTPPRRSEIIRELPSTKRDGKVSENAGKEIWKWMMPYRCP